MKALIIVLLVLGLLVQFLNIVSAARVDYHQHYRAYMGETFVMSGVSVLIYVVLIGYFAVKGLDDYNIWVIIALIFLLAFQFSIPATMISSL